MIMTPPIGTSRKAVITALGVTQILAWGSSFYLPAVLAKPISEDTGWSFSIVVAGLSAALLVAGLISPIVGRNIQHYGGRSALSFSSIMLALGLAVMGISTNVYFYIASWILVGVGMASGLYDASFATLGRLYGKDARSAITNLTLFGGFASTICWPFSAYLVGEFGWRWTCIIYAFIHLVICFPLHLFVLPKYKAKLEKTIFKASNKKNRSPKSIFWILATIFVLSSLISSTLSVHMLTVLQYRGADLLTAVSLGALIGPAQVGARILEMITGQRHHPIWTMFASTVLLAIGVALLWSDFQITAFALIIYGAGNGIFSIARGTVPLALFDPSEYASNMGKLAMPSLLVQALAPSLGAVLLDGGSATTLLITMLCIAALNVALVVTLVLNVRKANNQLAL